MVVQELQIEKINRFSTGEEPICERQCSIPKEISDPPIN